MTEYYVVMGWSKCAFLNILRVSKSSHVKNQFFLYLCNIIWACKWNILFYLCKLFKIRKLFFIVSKRINEVSETSYINNSLLRDVIAVHKQSANKTRKLGSSRIVPDPHLVIHSSWCSFPTLDIAHNWSRWHESLVHWSVLYDTELCKKYLWNTSGHSDNSHFLISVVSLLREAVLTSDISYASVAVYSFFHMLAESCTWSFAWLRSR